ncbi:MAG: hypothetical protein KGZ74_11370 [Chitinophagaceae bacterium]|jgi:hypothetical protein|nr:hypothetical protein [Chitinophagaceae bacterium]
MGLAVYNAVPLVLNDGETEHRFTLKLNPSTDSFRLESNSIKRSVFIGRRMFNKLFQLIRNEYGATLGRIQYSGNDMKRGLASTAEHEDFQFEIYEGDDVEVIIKKEQHPTRRLSVVIPNNVHDKREKEVRQGTLIPSVLAALIFSKEAKLIL